MGSLRLKEGAFLCIVADVKEGLGGIKELMPEGILKLIMANYDNDYFVVHRRIIAILSETQLSELGNVASIMQLCWHEST